MKGKLTLTQMRVILLLGAVLLIVLTYFLVYQRNMDEVSDYKKKTSDLKKRITELEGLKTEVTNLEVFTSLYTDEMDDYIQSFPVKLTQQKSVYLIYRLKINSGIDVLSITPGTQVPFYYKGNVLTSSGDQEQAKTDAEAEPLSEITVVDMDEMVGSTATYNINISGTAKQVYKALDWISQNKEKLSIGNVNLQFDKSTGKLSGSIGINFYCMLGNGVPYKEPDMSMFTYGMDGDVFGSFD